MAMFITNAANHLKLENEDYASSLESSFDKRDLEDSRDVEISSPKYTQSAPNITISEDPEMQSHKLYAEDEPIYENVNFMSLKFQRWAALHSFFRLTRKYEKTGEYFDCICEYCKDLFLAVHGELPESLYKLPHVFEHCVCCSEPLKDDSSQDTIGAVSAFHRLTQSGVNFYPRECYTSEKESSEPQVPPEHAMNGVGHINVNISPPGDTGPLTRAGENNFSSFFCDSENFSSSFVSRSRRFWKSHKWLKISLLVFAILFIAILIALWFIKTW